MSDKIVVKKQPAESVDPFDYVISVLEYAKFDLSYQRRLTEQRVVVPLTEAEKEYFADIVAHLGNAQEVLIVLKEKHNSKKRKWFFGLF